MATLSKGRKTDNFKLQKSLKLSFTNIAGLCLLDVNFSLNQTPLTFWLYVKKTWMTQLILAVSL